MSSASVAAAGVAGTLIAAIAMLADNASADADFLIVLNMSGPPGDGAGHVGAKLMEAAWSEARQLLNNRHPLCDNRAGASHGLLNDGPYLHMVAA